MVNIIIFSKDRACQLDLLIRSMIKYWIGLEKIGQIKVLYTYSNELYHNGYRKLIKKCENIFFIEFYTEESFKKQVVFLTNPLNKYTVFFVDDMVFKDYFKSEELAWLDRVPEIICISLRLGLKFTYCYMGKTNMTPPGKLNDNGTYNWTYYMGDYGYPMSVDGHIFRTDDIYQKLQDLNYSGPNQLEGELVCNPIHGKHLIKIFVNAPAFNNPCNKVQTVLVNNRSGNKSPEELNNAFLDDFIIDMSPYDGQVYNSCHCEQEIKLIKE